MQLNKFTIIIPTRERAETLPYAIQACLNQTYQNLEIIVSDNFSQDNTAEVVKSFTDQRLKYFNTGKRLSMSENFDFALRNVHDGFVMFIGDDDAVIPDCLHWVNSIINRTKCEAIVSHNAFYTWPGTAASDQMIISPYDGYEIRSSKEWIKKYLQFEMLYTFDLPGVYCGFVKKEILDNLSIKGSFFRSVTPDAYSALAVAASTDSYVFCHTPFALHGSSAKSNGAAYLSTEKNKEGNEVKLFFKENTIPLNPAIVMTKSFRVCSLEAFLQFCNEHPSLTEPYKVDWRKFLRFVLTERKEATKIEIEEAVKKMCEMHNISYQEICNNLPGRFSNLSFNDIVKKMIFKVRNFLSSRRTIINDVTKYGVYNVRDAALLLKYLLVHERGAFVEKNYKN